MDHTVTNYLHARARARYRRCFCVSEIHIGAIRRKRTLVTDMIFIRSARLWPNPYRMDQRMTSLYKHGWGLGEANKSDLIARSSLIGIEFYEAEEILVLQHHRRAPCTPLLSRTPAVVGNTSSYATDKAQLHTRGCPILSLRNKNIPNWFIFIVETIDAIDCSWNVKKCRS